MLKQREIPNTTEKQEKVLPASKKDRRSPQKWQSDGIVGRNHCGKEEATVLIKQVVLTLLSLGQEQEVPQLLEGN